MQKEQMLRAVSAAAVGMSLSLGSQANGWTCEQGGISREITIYYPDEPARLPCEVYYTKRDEKKLPRVLWSARHEEGYCARKAVWFIDKLSALGWHCTADAAATTND